MIAFYYVEFKTILYQIIYYSFKVRLMIIFMIITFLKYKFKKSNKISQQDALI